MKIAIKRGKERKISKNLKQRQSAIKAVANDEKGNVLRGSLIVDGKDYGRVPGMHKVPLCSQKAEIKTKKGSFSKELNLKEKKVFRIVAKIKSGETVANYKIYKKSGQTLVKDNDSGLIWQRDISSSKMDWSKAKNYCSNLDYAGYSDWKLPTISELKTLIKGCKSGGSACKVSDSCTSSSCYSKQCYCDNYKGPGEKGFYWQSGVWNYSGDKYGRFWSSSVLSDNSDGAWYVSFYRGRVSYYYKSYKSNVRCVRE